MAATYLPSPSQANNLHFSRHRAIVFDALTQYGLRSSFLEMLKRSAIATKHRSTCNFLRDCIEEHIIPKSHSILKRYNGLEHPFAPHTRQSLEAILRDQLMLKEEAYFISRQARRTFLQQCPPHLVDICLALCKRHNEHHNKEASMGHREKLNKLINDSLWTKAPLLDCVTNLSSRVLTDAQHQVLGLGLGFALPPGPDSLANFLVELNNLHRYGKDIYDELHTLRGIGLSYLQNLELHSTGFPKRFMEAIGQLKKMEDILITRADKGNRIVVLDKAFYIAKGEELLSDQKVYEQIDSNSP